MNKKILAFAGLSVLALGALVFIPEYTEAYRGDINVKGPNYSVERHEAMQKAFDNNDFISWQKLMDGKGRVSQVINKDNFAKFAEIHKLLQEGKKEEALKLRAELGLGLKNGMGSGMGKGMNRGLGKMNNR